MIQHHPALDLLTEYATGALGEAQALSIACHIALCEQCRRDVSELERVGGDLLEDLDPVAVAPEALETVLAKLDEPYTPPRPPVVDDETRLMLPSPLWHYVEGGLASLRWRRVTPSLSSARLALSRARHGVDILRITAGRAVPRHTHEGGELTLVLAGGFTDETGHFARGDFAYADDHLTHRPVADPGDDCIALAVVEAPVVPTGVVGRLLRPLMRG
jgi:putative transcriptional regulator